MNDEEYYEDPEEISNDDPVTADCDGLCFSRQLEEMAEIIKDAEEKVFQISFAYYYFFSLLQRGLAAVRGFNGKVSCSSLFFSVRWCSHQRQQTT